MKFSKTDQSPLIGIAATHAKEEEVLERSLQPNKAYLKITVRNNGTGFGNYEAGRIFGAFTRLHSKDKYEGTGLGLALCRKIMERYRGTIEATGKQRSGVYYIAATE